MRTAMVLGVIFFSFSALLAQAPPGQAPAATAQETLPDPPDYKLRAGKAEWRISNVNIDDAKAALAAALEEMGWKVMNTTSSGLVMNVMADLPGETDQAKIPKAFVGIAPELTDAQVIGNWYLGQKGKAKSPPAEAKAFWDELFSRMLRALGR